MKCKYGFKIVRKGYDPSEVDAYIDAQLQRMTEMHEQNTNLMRRLSEAQDMIRRYSATEKSLRASIAQSKRGAADLISDARDRSTDLVDTARKECNRIVDELDAKIEEKYKTIDEIKSSVFSFKQELFQLYSDHIEMIESLSEAVDEFKYTPDFDALSQAIDSFEEAAGKVEEPEVPQFPEVPEESFFAEEEEEVTLEGLTEEELQDINAELDLEDAEAEAAAEEEAVAEKEAVAEDPAFEEETEIEVEVEVDEADEDDEMFFDISEEEMKAAEALFDEEATPAKESDPLMETSDDMFIKNSDDVKEKEELFNFLKDFVNGSEE